MDRNLPELRDTASTDESVWGHIRQPLTLHGLLGAVVVTLSGSHVRVGLQVYS